MADHDVKLHYSPNPEAHGRPLFRAEPQTIFVKQGQTISFQKADDSMGGSILITFANPQIFSAPKTDGSIDIQVTGTPIATTYHCQLLGSNGSVLAESSATQVGGDIVPDLPSA